MLAAVPSIIDERAFSSRAGVGARWWGDGQVLLETPQCGLGVRHDNTTAVSPLASARVSRTRRRGHAHRASAGARATTRALRTASSMRIEIAFDLR